MANENILDVLKAMGKATLREIAARMEIELPDAMAMLGEHKETGEVKFKNGGWSLSGYKEPKTPVRIRGESPAKIIKADEPVVPEEPESRANQKPEKSSIAATEALVASIPSFTEGRPDDLIIPSVTEMARVIRKARHNLHELEEIRKLSIQIKKYRKTIISITTSQRGSEA